MLSSLKHKIVGVFNSDFGANYGFGNEDYYKIKELWSNDYIEKLIYRDYIKSKNFNYNLIQKAIPFGKWFPRILTGLDIYSKSFLKTTYYDQIIFDFFASKKIPHIKNGFFFTSPPCLKCCKQAKNLGYTVVLSSVYHPKWAWELISKEYEKFKIPINSSYEQRIFHRSTESIKCADFIFTPSEITKQTFISNGFNEKKIFLTPIGTSVTANQKNHENRQSKIKFLFVANVTLMKGLHYLISAWKELKLPNAELIICGKILPEMEKLILNDLKNCNSIKYMGFITNLESYYQNSSVFILPSLFEGMSRVVLDAMAYGLPVIATPIAAPCIKNHYDGILIEPGNIEQIKNAILYLYEHPSEIIRMGKNASQTILSFTYEGYSKKVVESFEVITSLNLK